MKSKYTNFTGNILQKILLKLGGGLARNSSSLVKGLALFICLALSLDVLAATVPEGFVDELIYSQGMDNKGLNIFLGIQFLPDGRALTWDRGGRIYIFNPNDDDPVNNATTYMKIPEDIIETKGKVNQVGLLDLELDPNFSSNNYFYLYYMHKPVSNPSEHKKSMFRISRFKHQDDSADFPSEEVIWVNTDPITNSEIGNKPNNHLFHPGGGLDFANDGSLYLTIGDSDYPNDGDEDVGLVAQNDAFNAGKLIRIHPVEPCNNLADCNDREILARGLRHPFKASFDDPTQRFFIANVGGEDKQNSVEELDIFLPSSPTPNYGWPQCEGDTCVPPGSPNQVPLYSYRHLGKKAAIIGGVVYRGNKFPAKYSGAYFFSDYERKWLRYLTFKSDDDTVVEGDFKEFSADIGHVVHIEQSPDGHLYYMIAPSDRGRAEIRRIRYTEAGANPPVVSIESPQNGATFDQGDSITFEGMATDDEDDDTSLTESIIWSSNLDDEIGIGGMVSTSDLRVGEHTITATVTDSTELSDVDDITITVNDDGGGPSPRSLEVQVDAREDDAEEQMFGTVILGSADLELVRVSNEGENGNQTVGLRFNGITLPQGTTILSAYVQFTADETRSEPTSLTIHGEASDNAKAFSKSDFNISSRLLTTASVAWSPAPWTMVGDAGSAQRTPDMTPVIQEIVDQPGWSDGNSLAIVITGEGKRTADSYGDNRKEAAALLHIEFDPGVSRGRPPEPKLIASDGDPLIASDGDPGDRFGASTSISGNTLIVGADEDDGLGTDSGSAYIFTRSADGRWTEQEKLTAFDGAEGDRFGLSTSISGDTVIVGAVFDDDLGTDSGSAYIFTRSADGVWTQQAKLTAADGAQFDAFGFPVSISGDTAIVGADSSNEGDGSAYIFTRSTDGVWTQQAKLTASDGAINDKFGVAVSISGDTAIVGADNHDGACPSDPICDSGSAYIFTRSADGVWTEKAKLAASDAKANEHFGINLSISGDAAIISALADDDNDTGSAYIFTRTKDGAWTEQAKLAASDREENDLFGRSVSISNGVAIIGAFGNDDAGSSSGSAYVFTRSGNGVWTESRKLTAFDAAKGDLFGSSVFISGGTAIVGADGDDDGTGSAYIYTIP